MLAIALFCSSSVNAAWYLCCRPNGQAEIWGTTTFENGQPGPAAFYAYGGVCTGGPWVVEIDHPRTNPSLEVIEADASMYDAVKDFKGATSEEKLRNVPDEFLIESFLSNDIEKRWFDPTKMHSEIGSLIKPGESLGLYGLVFIKNPPDKIIKVRSDAARSIVFKILDTNNNILYSSIFELVKGENEFMPVIPSNISGLKIISLESEVNTLNKTVNL